ncbi:glutathione S-transferase 1 [Glossina fuscipes]|uniref:Glutathione S-transferase 1 n=2 Tax=Nemorhina TaxID=44051 RepID=A0A9C5YYT7_9MUSC|nr:glutathione S-transferase 1 [Glossina fuscipes]XP_037888531.1 glutathione S-transferase 1 [Glossina fuscipes]XP_037888532.1 glutathione S-transferase 1 [Glossina fuscipes]XP_037888533.1 glutathione S-transferase 1 [Glossina fuscipes]XP_037888534.1 glutathione S-transferase 1 [Glossina fuscipes]
MSSKPVLYYTPRSPPCRAVLLTAAALGVELDLRAMNIKDGDHLTPEFLKLNPLHTVPVLDDNGLIISDSHVICSYLADKYAVDETLYPKDKLERMEVDARMYFDCGHLFPRVRLMVEPVLYFGCGEISEEKVTYMQKAYDGLERCLITSKYLCGDHMTIADLCCVASVSTAVLFAPIDEQKFPKLKSWLEVMSQLPYYKKNNQQGAEILLKFVQDKLAEHNKQKAKKSA